MVFVRLLITLTALASIAISLGLDIATWPMAEFLFLYLDSYIAVRDLVLDLLGEWFTLIINVAHEEFDALPPAPWFHLEGMFRDLAVIFLVNLGANYSSDDDSGSDFHDHSTPHHIINPPHH